MGSGAGESGAGDTGSESLAEPGTSNQQQAGNGETEAQAGEDGADLVAGDELVLLEPGGRLGP
ncbi:MAG: hypothetical protein ACK535_17125, partial [Cyanobacteriota bacterium]